MARDTAVVLVTGAAGAIGNATVQRFLAVGFAVAGLDRCSPHPATGRPGYTAIDADLEDAADVAAALDRCEGAGCSDRRHVSSVYRVINSRLSPPSPCECSRPTAGRG